MAHRSSSSMSLSRALLAMQLLACLVLLLSQCQPASTRAMQNSVAPRAQTDRRGKLDYSSDLFDIIDVAVPGTRESNSVRVTVSDHDYAVVEADRLVDAPNPNWQDTQRTEQPATTAPKRYRTKRKGEKCSPQPVYVREDLPEGCYVYPSPGRKRRHLSFKLNSCQGSCHSVSKPVPGIPGLSDATFKKKCRCCRPNKTREVHRKIMCKGQLHVLKFTTAESCSCSRC